MLVTINIHDTVTVLVINRILVTTILINSNPDYNNKETIGNVAVE